MNSKDMKVLLKHVNELKRQLKEANNTILQLRSELSKAKKHDSLAVKGKWVEL